MPNESFYIPDNDEDLQEYVQSLPNKSEVIRRTLRQHKEGAIARADERIGEIDDELDDIEAKMDGLRARRKELKDERARLEEQQESHEDETDSLVEETVSMFEAMVSTLPDERRRYLPNRPENVPERVWTAVEDEVDIHHFDNATGNVRGEHVEDDLQAAGFDVDEVLGEFGKVEGEEAVDYLHSLTDREREEIEAAVNEVR